MSNKITLEKYINAIKEGDRTLLSKAITLLESTRNDHFELSRNLLQELHAQTDHTFRIGVSGVPGAGKSTFINALGKIILHSGLKLAVLAVDPSSSISGGSILGDKTRMADLIASERCFIRPSPSSGVLGGVGRATRETILLCEQAGYDVILVETVGVGQSEYLVQSMTDMFLLLAITGGGDELQGMKRGIMEWVDFLVINKADGQNKTQAEKVKKLYKQSFDLLHPEKEIPLFTCSSTEEEGLTEIWKSIKSWFDKRLESSEKLTLRKKQLLNYFHEEVLDIFQNKMQNRDNLQLRNSLEQEITEGKITPYQAAQQMFQSLMN